MKDNSSNVVPTTGKGSEEAVRSAGDLAKDMASGTGQASCPVSD